MLKIYTQPKCPYCDEVKERIKQLGVEYQEVDLRYVSVPVYKKLFEELNGKVTTPQIYYNDNIFCHGGASGLRALSDEQILEKLKELDNK